MIRLKYTLVIFILSLTLTACGQSSNTIDNKDHITALAKFISYEGGDKIHLVKFKIIKDFSDTLIISDTILVGYNNNKQPEGALKNVLLTINKYNEQTQLKNYYICPDYDGKVGIQGVKIDYVDFEYWEGCETENGDCIPLTFSRTRNDKKWFLIMPCGGTETSISITGNNFKKQLHLFHDNCPPFLELSSLEDGMYTASMMACGLGGTINFTLTTK